MNKKRILPPTYLFLSIVAMVVLRLVLPVAHIISCPYNLLGAIPIVIGFVVNVMASNTFDCVGTTVKPFEESSELVTSGVFRFSRHPMYAGMIALLAGIAVILATLAPFLILIPFIWIMREFAIVEEKAMDETFGDAYREYSTRVRRWI